MAAVPRRTTTAAVASPSPPGPVLQHINAALHREPAATLAYGFYWSLVLAVGTPLAILFLLLRTLFRLLHLLFWYNIRLWPSTVHASSSACDPTTAGGSEYEMAVVITGCDSGFGKELALWAADAGYTVFAGCLEKSSWEGAGWPDRILPVPMDVTSDAQVNAAVVTVEAWLRNQSRGSDDAENTGASTNTNITKKRVLHALINNAGVGTGGLVDWADLSDFKLCTEGTYCNL